MNVTLGLDTSTTACSAAVLRGDRILAARFEVMERGQAERLNPMVGEVMAEAGIAFSDLNLVAITVGPGAFTGLRIGLACARAIALAAGVPLAGVTTFTALARAIPKAERAGRDILVCVDGKRRDVFVQQFNAGLAPQGAPGALDPDEAAQVLRSGAYLIAGDGAPRLRDVLTAAGDAGEGVMARLRFSSAVAPPDARHVAALGQAAGPSTTLPRALYVRPPDVRPPSAP